MTAPIFSTLGALIGLVLAIILIVKKVHPAYSLIFGALIGGVNWWRRTCGYSKSHGYWRTKHDVSCPSYHDKRDLSWGVN